MFLQQPSNTDEDMLCSVITFEVSCVTRVEVRAVLGRLKIAVRAAAVAGRMLACKHEGNGMKV